MNELQRILAAVDRGTEANHPMAMATVVNTHGSVYRRPGARMLLTLVGDDVQRVSAISGGCLEQDVAEQARSLLESGQPYQLLRYDTTASDDEVMGLGLGCSGVVEVLLESLQVAAAIAPLRVIQTWMQTQQSGVMATVFAVDPDASAGVTVGDRLLVTASGIVPPSLPDPDLAERIATDAQLSLSRHRPTITTYTRPQGQVSVLLEPIHPPLPLLVFGAGYDAIPVVQLAKHLGWQVSVIDHRPAYLSRDRFPAADQLIQAHPSQPHTYQPHLTPQAVAVVMTHHYPSDLAVLRTLIAYPLRYVGVLGPSRRMQQLEQELGVSSSDRPVQIYNQVYNPVGLDIAAETPEEIALAIVAEIQAVIGGGSGGFLRDRPGPIHAPLPMLHHDST